jgi:hypothetical protein
MFKNESNILCLLCSKDKENIKHFIPDYERLEEVRKPILQEIEEILNDNGGPLLNYSWSSILGAVSLFPDKHQPTQNRIYSAYYAVKTKKILNTSSWITND